MLGHEEKKLLGMVRLDRRFVNKIPEELLDNKEFALELLEVYEGSFLNFSERLRDDEEVVAAALRKDGSLITDASERLRNDREMCQIAVLQNRGALQWVGDEMRNDVDLAIYARKRWFNADEFTPSHVLYSDEYMEKWERFITGKDK